MKIQKATLWTLALVLVTTAAVAQPYDIVVDRPYTVGQKFQLTLEQEQIMSGQTVLGRQTQTINQSSKASLKADGEVLTVLADGTADKVRYVLRSYEELTNGKPGPAVPAGMVFIAHAASNPNSVTLEDGTPLGDSLDTLASMLQDATDPPQQDGDFIGADGPKNPGDTWLVDGQSVMDQLLEAGMEALPNGASVSGGARLASVGNVNGIPCLQVRASFVFSGFTVPDPRVQQVQAKGRFKAGIDVPVDGSKNVQRQTLELVNDISMVINTPQGQATSQMNQVMKATARFRFQN